jgi:signal transduction histidine kinase
VESSYKPDRRYRLGLTVLLAVVGIVTVTCVHASLIWIDRPFNGFLLGRNRIVAPIAQPHWSGPRAGVPYWAQLVAIDGEPVDDVATVLSRAAEAGEGQSLRYTFRQDGRDTTLPIEVIRFTVADYLGLFANYLFNGLAFLFVGFFVAFLRPQQKAAHAMLAFSLSWGLSLIISIADFASFHFRELLAIAEASAPASLLYLTLCFPTEHALSQRRKTITALVGISVLLAALNIILYDHAPNLWIQSYGLGLVWAAVAVVLSVALMWNQYRNAASPIAREKIKIVFLGIIVAFALPAAVYTAGQIIDAALPLNVLPAATWVFPAALAYAIVKRDLFEIDVFLRRAASYVALSTAVLVLYVAAVGLVSQVFHNLRLASSPWFTLLFSLGVLAVVRPLRDWLQAAVDRIFFRTHFDYVQITESLSQALTRTLDMDEVSRHVRQAVTATMAPTFCRLFHAFDGDTFRCADRDTADVVPDPFVREALASGRILDGTNLPNAAVSPELVAALLVPLCFESQIEGLLVLGPKNSGAPYGPRDLELLRTLANQTAMALRNVSSYHRVTELLSSLETRVEERTRELQDTQAELRASNEKLRELDRQKTQFFSDASHELRTPLTLVLGPLEELRRHAASLDPQARKLVTVAHSNSAKLLVLTDTLLDLSRLDADHMKPICSVEILCPLLERTAEPFRWLAEQRGIDLQLPPTSPTLTAWCDARMLSKIVGNLLANALKFTMRGSVRIDLIEKGELVGIRVTDSGPGIAVSELPYIFDRYRQASTAGRSTAGGSGLGLALVRELTELHGGRVEVCSQEGEGTTFTVWLPTSPGAGATPSSDHGEELPTVILSALAAEGGIVEERDLPATGIEAAHQSASVLVVDDNPAVVDLLRDLLSGAYEVLAANSAADALNLLQSRRPDLILSDVMMPGPDGVALCQTLKRDERWRRIPLILLTARASLESKLVGLEAGADDYITKPFHPDELKARIATLLRTRDMERELARSHDELAHAYEELRDAQSQLIQAEKMASLGTLVAGVAHEINNPVSFVNSSIDLITTSIAELRNVLDRHLQGNGNVGTDIQALRQDLDYEYRVAMLQENAAICRDGAARAARIVNDLRTFCRPGTGLREAADLHASLEQSLRLLQGEYKGRVTVHRDYGDLPRVVCDAGQISQVFVNLLANAMQAIEGSGDVFVRTRRADDSIRVEIEDTGRGIEDAMLSRVFDPFFTTKEVGKGTGLGLSIVRSLVNAHGGRIDVSSQNGHGCIFTLTLPIQGVEHEQH